ncbi:MAG: DUF6754 domain-containing protein [Bacteroidota bacterium]
MAELVLILVSILLLAGLALLPSRAPRKFRHIPAFARLYRAMGLSVEEGTRLHVSLGRGGLLGARGGASLAALAMLRQLSERTSMSDQPPVASTGDPAVVLLAQDSLRAGYQAARALEQYVPTTGRLTGPTPFSFAAGAIPIVRDENVSANLLIGDFGAEVALMADAALRVGAPTIGGTDDLAAQSILYAAAQEPLIGEEMFAAGAYLGADPAHAASLTVQDVLRWLLIAFMLGGALLKLLGLI